MSCRNKRNGLAVLAAAVLGGAALWAVAEDARLGKWEIHDMKRPKPPVVEPGTFSTQEQPGKPPADAIVLLGGDNIDKWQGAQWKVEGGAMIVGGGTLTTKDAFGDCQLHVEWSAPTPPTGESQDRGNSGIYLMGQYEVQVLDSYENETYADGQAAAMYGQFPPLVNVMVPPGQWNVYDIIFRAPRFEGEQLKSPARMTVLHNGVLVQDNVELTGPSGHHARPPYKAHPDKLPITLQDHNNPVKFRNIWIRPLDPTKPE